ncbi:arrestin domain-containing protein 17-like [Bolinopsis microptera]|uniref:arrestin domain-containing protein 17-like n=1 Tax=Bolinopsis microptera TaxID=2820187 RepID=UPI003078CDB0
MGKHDMFELSDSDSDGEEESSPEEKPMEIRVKLDREVYFVGQDISGVVEIDNKYKRRMRGIRLTLRCRSEVVWWEERGSLVGKKEKVKQFNDDNLMYTEKYIVGEGKTMFLQAGDNIQFPFSISLKGKKKRKLPSSMELPKGHIRYYLKAEVDWPWAVVQDHERLVSVVDACNLCDVRDALQPATFTKTFKVGLSRKKIHVAGRLEKLGYVPGEEILLHVEIDNNSSSKISNSWIQLVEIVKYLSSGQKVETSRNVLNWSEMGSIAGRHDLVKEKEPLLLPVVAQSAVNIVEFMKVSHEISIMINVNGMEKSVSQRIIVGTIPTKHCYNRFHMGRTPPKQLFLWPYDHMTKIPCPNIAHTAPNDEVNWQQIKQIDPDFRLQNVCYEFDHDKAVEAFDDPDASESESDGDGEDSQGHMSDFSI